MLFATLAEPAMIMIVFTVALVAGSTQLSAVAAFMLDHATLRVSLGLALIGLIIVALAENARIPVDNPLTHLELTMIHEVMVLDHSGPELAAMQFAAAMKMTLYAGLIAALLNPFNPLVSPVAAVIASLGLMLAVAGVVGCIESLTARLPMRWVTHYLLIASAAALGCMVVVGMGGSR